MSEKASWQDLSTFDDLLQSSLQEDKEFAHRWKVVEVFSRFGAQVRKERARLGLSQEELAARAGTAQPNVSRIEHASANPTLETMAKIARALDLDISELIRPKKVRGRLVSLSVESRAAQGGVTDQGDAWGREHEKPWKRHSDEDERSWREMISAESTDEPSSNMALAS